MKRYLDALAIGLNQDGKVILGDHELERIEQSFVPSGGGTTNSGTCDGTNNVCTNSGDCTGSTNQTQCMNTMNCVTRPK